MRIVVDTNVLISRLLLPQSSPAKAVLRVVREHEILVSSATMAELTGVLARPKFDRYVTRSDRRRFLADLERFAVWVPVIRRVRACRDSRDDKFLELAVNGEADAILTGDADLLVLHPFRGVAILTPGEWLLNSAGAPNQG